MPFQLIKNIGSSLLNIAFPHVCEGCGMGILNTEHFLCLSCLSKLPETKFALYPDNPFERIFYGKLDLVNGAALYYYTKNSLMQHLLHQFKYRNHKRLGIYLGKLMGNALRDSGRFGSVDAIIPLPLFRRREKDRGFNQSAILCLGIAEVLKTSIVDNAIIRNTPTESQTKKGRIDRWQNMKDRFEVINEEPLINKHLLLIDDVITTGATLDACGAALLKTANTRLSIASLCFSIET